MPAKRIPNGEKHLEWVPVAQCRVSPRAQRDHTTQGALSRIEDIAANFDPDQFGTLTCSKRGGVYWIIDGGHRWNALLKMGYQDQQVQAWVYHGLTEDEEADLFLALNNVRPVSAMDKFKVAVVAARPVETNIDTITRGLGLSIGGSKVGKVSCVKALLKVYDFGGPKVLETTLRVLRDSYGDPGFAGKIVEGIGMFVANYQNDFDEAQLVSKLSRKLGGVNGLLGRAEQIRSSHGVGAPTGVAAAVVETYNQGRGGVKLTGWWSKLEERQSA